MSVWDWLKSIRASEPRNLPKTYEWTFWDIGQKKWEVVSIRYDWGEEKWYVRYIARHLWCMMPITRAILPEQILSMLRHQAFTHRTIGPQGRLP